MKRYIYSLGAVLLLGAGVPAMAQGYYYGPGPDLPLHFYVDGGYSVMTGQTSNYLDNGWNIGGGVQWRPAPGPFSLRGPRRAARRQDMRRRRGRLRFLNRRQWRASSSHPAAANSTQAVRMRSSTTRMGAANFSS
jgi:hypothetical protein